MRPTVVVVGLGPAGDDLVSAGTLSRIESFPPDRRFLRTRVHPSASVVGDAARSFDDLYDGAASIDDVYRGIVDALVAAAQAHGSVLYAVPGSPAVAERTVELLRADDRVDVEVHAALSFLDLAWVRLGIDPVAAGVRIVDGHRFATEAAGERGPLLVAQTDTTAVLSEVKLALSDGLDDARADALTVTVLAHLGLPDERVETVAWHELDRVVGPDHLTSVYVPAAAPTVGHEMARLVELVTTLRRECPWDREQTHASLERHLLEETYEVIDAIDHLDVDAGTGYEHLEEELGDLLFQVLFHSTLAAEVGRFTLADVAREVHDKLYARHPHVFGEVRAETPDQVAANWEQLKREEKGRTSVFDGIPEALPALLLALKVLKKAEALEQGSTVEGHAGARAAAISRPSLDEAFRSAIEPLDAATVGALLLAVVERARHADVDPEAALRVAALRYRDRAVGLEATDDPEATTGR